MFTPEEQLKLLGCGLKVVQEESSVRIQSALGPQHALFWAYFSSLWIGMLFLFLPLLNTDFRGIPAALLCGSMGICICCSGGFFLLRSRTDCLAFSPEGFVGSFGLSRFTVGYSANISVAVYSSYADLAVHQTAIKRLVAKYQDSLFNVRRLFLRKPGARGLAVRRQGSIIPLLQIPNIQRSARNNAECLDIIHKVCQAHVVEIRKHHQSKKPN